jgi:hypothetical protein
LREAKGDDGKKQTRRKRRARSNLRGGRGAERRKRRGIKELGENG